MLNLLWVSNSASAPSGYGNQTAVFTRRLKAAGYDPVIGAFFGAEGAPFLNGDGILTLPRGIDPYFNDILPGHFNHPHWADGKPGNAVISLIDPFVLRGDVWSGVPWAAWTPVDSVPVYGGNVRALASARWVWSMSRFGDDQLRAAGFDPIYVPHGVESAIFRPMDRGAARKALGAYLGRDLDSAFLVVSVAANKGTPSRKNFVSMIEAFSLFVRGSSALGIAPHPDALLYLHTEPRGVWGGEDIRAIAEAFGVADRVLLPVQYHVIAGLLGPEFLNNVYNAGDVFLLLSSEGFGIPIIESQLAGCPVIVGDFSASPELCFAGWKVLGLRKYIAATGVFWYEPVIPEAARALCEAYAQRDDGTLRHTARWGALEYDADEVFARYMLPAIQRIARELTPHPAPHSHETCVSGSPRNTCFAGVPVSWRTPVVGVPENPPGFLGCLGGEGHTLHLGCGVRPLPGALNHDRTRHAPYVDVAHDLDALPWPWADAAFDRIIALDVLEHLHVEVKDWLGECWRILKPGGELIMRLPAHDNPVSYRDTTHRRVFHEESFDFFDPDKPLWRAYGHFYYADAYPDGPRWWRIADSARVNPDPRYGVGDLAFTLRKRPSGSQSAHPHETGVSEGTPVVGVPENPPGFLGCPGGEG